MENELYYEDSKFWTKYLLPFDSYFQLAINVFWNLYSTIEGKSHAYTSIIY